MSDLISRQAAIANMNKVIMFRKNPEWKDRVATYLKSLPSAQPEQRWISVNKELPKKDGEYLVTVGGEATFPDVDTAWFYYGHWIHQFGCTVKVIAWMPLPKPYREGADE